MFANLILKLLKKNVQINCISTQGYFFLLYVSKLLMESIVKNLNESEVCEILNEISRCS